MNALRYVEHRSIRNLIPMNPYNWVMRPRPMDVAQAREGARGLVLKYVLRNSGSREDAEDLLQDGVLVLLQRMERADFLLRVPPHAYLFAVCRNLWLKRLRDDKSQHHLALDQTAELADAVDLREAELLETRLQFWLGKLTVRCQFLLTSLYQLSFLVQLEQRKPEYATAHSMASQKHKCLKSLRAEATANFR